VDAVVAERAAAGVVVARRGRATAVQQSEARGSPTPPPPTQQKGTKSLDTSYGTFHILIPKILSGALVATLEKVKA